MKTNLDKLFKTNEHYESEGIWMEISDETAFKVRRFGGNHNTAFKEAYARHMKPHLRSLENGTMSHKKENTILTKFFVESCLIDWRGVVINGEEASFSKEAAYKLFERLPDLLKAIIEEAKNRENFLEEQLEDLGNF